MPPQKPRPPRTTGSRPGTRPPARRPRVRPATGAAKRGHDRLLHLRRQALLWLSRLGIGGRVALAVVALLLVAGGMTALLGQQRYHPVASGPALTPQEEQADAAGADEPQDASDEAAVETADLPTRPGPAPAVPATRPAQSSAPIVGSTTPPQQLAALPAIAPRPLPPITAAPAGIPAWKHFAVAPPTANGHPRIVIVIDDLGVDRHRSDKVVALPGPLTLAWLPYAHELPLQTERARANGHELIVHMPMEPVGKDDPGPGALLTHLDDATLHERLVANLSAFQGFVGINNHMGSRFTADQHDMALVMAELAARGLMFLDSRTTPDTKARPLSEHYRVPMLSRDVFLDDDMTPRAVALSLAKVEQIASRSGLAIAIGHPHDVTIAALTQWLPTLKDKGFQLIPLTAALK